MKNIIGFICWFLFVSIFIALGVSFCNLFAFLLGIAFLFGFFIIGLACEGNTSQGRKNIENRNKKQKEIEKEYGIIDYSKKD